HSDLNGALNIMRKATGKVPLIIKKPLSFTVDHNKVAPTKRCNTQDPNKTPPKRRERGHLVNVEIR
ncbi:hypothetical protein B7L70_01425, partial [Vulcanisaeta sp. EB80]